MSTKKKFARPRDKASTSENPNSTLGSLELTMLVREAARILGARGGAAGRGVSTPAKRRSSRENGKKGGRPRNSGTASADRAVALNEKPAENTVAPLATSSRQRSVDRGLVRRKARLDQATLNLLAPITTVRVGRGTNSLLELLKLRVKSSSELGGRSEPGNVVDRSQQVKTLATTKRAKTLVLAETIFDLGGKGS